MVAFKKIIAATALAVLSVQSAAALPSHPIDMAKVFADCAGRLTALAQYSETKSTVPSQPPTHTAHDALARAEHFIMLLDAVEADARALGLPEGTARSWQLSAKAAHGVLLHMAENGNPASSVRAARAAETHMTMCNHLIL